MSSRNQYTYTPGYGMSNSPVRERQTSPRQQAMHRTSMPRRQDANVAVKRPAGDTAILALLFIVAPISGVLGVFFSTFLWVFIGVTLVILVAMWALQCFEPRGRAFVSGILIVLMAVALIAAFVDNSQGDQKGYFPQYGGDTAGMNGNAGNTNNANNPFIGNSGNNANDGGNAVNNVNNAGNSNDGDSPAVAPPNYSALTVPTFAPPSGVINTAPELTANAGTDDNNNVTMTDGTSGVQYASEAHVPSNDAEVALDNYLKMWQQQNYEDMVQYTLPSWQAVQTSPARQLNWNHTGWILNSWTVMPTAITTVVDSATIVITARLTKNTSAKTEAVMEYQAIVQNIDGKWYVDPDSMRNGLPVVQATPSVESQPAEAQANQPQTSPTTNPDLKLWYNPDGGKFYHLEQKCADIKESYYKLMKSFKFSQLSESTFAKLRPCPTCKAPKK